MTRSWKSWLPGITVALLLALALLAPARRVSAVDAPAEPDYLYYPTCTQVTQGGAGSTTPFPIAPGEGITQPLGEPGNFASTILTQPTQSYCGAQVDVVYWDPQALAPSANQLMLRTRSYIATDLLQDLSRQDWFPPVITRALTNVAEPPPTQVALEQRTLTSYYQNTRDPLLVHDDSTPMPAGMRINSDGSRIFAPGTHPVFSYQLCGGDATLQDLRVVQCVMSADASLSPTAAEYIQKFRVPVAASVRWIELAFGAQYPSGQLDWGRVRIIDAAGQDAPQSPYGTPIVDAQISVWAANSTVGQWDSHLDLGTFPTLQANHDYWLVVNPVGDYWFMTKTLHGTESPYFTTTVGGLWRRDTADGGATALPGRALSFRIIGTPSATVSVGSPALSRGALALAISPNPARGGTEVAWAGARGGVRFEVLDARGRRVAAGSGAAGAEGRWSWSGAGDDGRMLPAGVYFVRARDEAGRSASARLSLVR